MIHLLIEDDDGIFYEVPESFHVEITPFSINRSYEHRTDSPGAEDIGDGQPRERIINITGWLAYDTIEELIDKDREIQQAFLKGGKIYYSTIMTQYLEVRLNDNQPEQGQVENHKLYSLTGTAKNPFWQDTTLDAQAEVMAGSGSFNVDFSGSAWEYRPEIKIQSNQGASLPTLTLTNNTTGESFTYTNAAFTTGKTLIVDGRLGIVTLEGSDSHNKMVKPWTHIRLWNKVNSFSYTGNACTITISRRKQYV